MQLAIKNGEVVTNNFTTPNLKVISYYFLVTGYLFGQREKYFIDKRIVPFIFTFFTKPFCKSKLVDVAEI